MSSGDTYGACLAAIRKGMELNQGRFAAILKMGVVRLRALERGTERVDPDMARVWGDRLLAAGVHPSAVQHSLERAKKGSSDA